MKINYNWPNSNAAIKYFAGDISISLIDKMFFMD